MNRVKVAFWMLLGVASILIGCVLTTPQYKTGEAFSEKEPIIFVVTDIYNAPIKVQLEENDSGVATLGVAMNPEKKSEIEECTVYVIISDSLAPFRWKATSNVQVKKLEKKSDILFYSEDLEVSSGYHSELCFSFHLSREDRGITEINLKFDPSYQSKRENGYCEFRLPIFESHYGNTLVTPLLNYDSVQYVDPNAPDVYYSTMIIDQKPFYAADAVMGLEFVEVSSFISSELSRDIVAPSPLFDRPTIVWEGQNRLAPYLRYEDRVWMERRDARMILGGVLIGLGGGIVTAPVGNLLNNTKKRNGEELQKTKGEKVEQTTATKNGRKGKR